MYEDQMINEKLKYLEMERANIAKLAERYGLFNDVKIEKFSLLTIMHPSHHGHHHMHNFDPNNMLHSVDPKDRIKEYHEKVH